ncbi:transcription factor IIF subunit tfg1 [Entomophthora muscae]|uniref:Transcription factor IIF subunit tfg1 n=1 Tax=Entomophthora muscae TaxID=34485 RepID=A0ACC2RIA9_9FUNG|nr:transcription factor IIF subunit tfg1 [Entomophthora muscae]
MNEEFKDMTFYKAPPAKPRAPIPPAPKREPKPPSICFIDNPKSLPTDLRKYERPRQYYEQVKLLPKLPYKPPVLLPVKRTDLRLKAKIYALRGTQRDSPGTERHVMQVIGTKIKKIATLPRPLQLKRKKVAEYADLVDPDEDTKPGALTSAELKKIAPDGGAASNKRFQFKKKTRQIFEHDAKAREQRQREANPWVLESDIGSATPKEELRGTVEGGSTARYVALVHSKQGGFTVRPLKRIYNFQPRPTYHIPTAEETEALLNAKKKVNMDKWFALTKNKAGSKDDDAYADDSRFTTVEKDDDDEEGRGGGGADDIEDLDFDEDFQDDEEMGLDSVYEDTKENEDRLKQKQKRLNPTSESTDEDEPKNKKTDSSVKKLKRMVKTEGAIDSDSDSDSEPDAPVKKNGVAC